MNKVLVEIYVPAVQETFDVFIPDKVPFHQMLEGITQVVANLTEDKYLAAPDAVLCDGKTGAVYDINMNARELLLHNGSQLMLL